MTGGQRELLPSAGSARAAAGSVGAASTIRDVSGCPTAAMEDNPRHFPEVDEFVWLVESGELTQPWGRWWSPPGGPRGGLAPCPFEAEPVLVARQALDGWFTAAAIGDLEAEDLWLRASVWRLGRIVDGGLIRATPSESPDVASYGTLLYRSAIAPDAVEVRTPFQVVRAVDEARRFLPPA